MDANKKLEITMKKHWKKKTKTKPHTQKKPQTKPKQTKQNKTKANNKAIIVALQMHWEFHIP